MGWFFASLTVEGMKAKRDVKGLIKALKDKNAGVREAATKALGEIGEPAIEPLIQALKDEHEGVRWGAVEALGKIRDSRAVEPLIQTLKDEDVQWGAARALGKIGGSRATETLIQALKDEHWAVRWAAAEALGDIGEEPAVESLIQALKDENEGVREAAAEALQVIGGPELLSSKGNAKATSKKTKEQPSADLEGRAIRFESLDSFKELIRSKYNLSAHEYEGTIEPETLIGILEQIEESILIYWSIEKETVKEVGRGSVFSSQAGLTVFPKGSPKDEPCDNMCFEGLAKFQNKKHLDYFLESGRLDKADMGIGDDLIFSRFMFGMKWDNYVNQPYSREPITVNDLKKIVAERKAELGLR